MKPRHSREEVRIAKATAVERFRDDTSVTSVGIGMTEDRADYAVTITVSTAKALRRIPGKIGSVPVRVAVDGESMPF